jgi:hypothetical protein
MTALGPAQRFAAHVQTILGDGPFAPGGTLTRSNAPSCSGSAGCLSERIIADVLAADNHGARTRRAPVTLLASWSSP